LPRQREERAKPTILTELKISETRDSIVKVNDHKVIFIDTKGNPVDRGALEIKEAKKLPHYEDLMFERARLYQDSGKQISLPVKENRNIPITAENLLNSLKSLLDVVNEKQLTFFSINKGDLEELPRRHNQEIERSILNKNNTHYHLHRGSNHPTSGSAN
jgi:hypothetical protein